MEKESANKIPCSKNTCYVEEANNGLNPAQIAAWDMTFGATRLPQDRLQMEMYQQT